MLAQFDQHETDDYIQAEITLTTTDGINLTVTHFPPAKSVIFSVSIIITLMEFTRGPSSD